MTVLNFCVPGSRGSSTGSSKNKYCYPLKCPQANGFKPLGRRGSSSPNFLAESKKVCRKYRVGTKIITQCENEIKTSATTATHTAQSLGNKEFFRVAAPETTATRTATHCYPRTARGRSR